MKRMLALLLVLGVVVAQPSAEETAEGAVVAMNLSDLTQGADTIFSGQVISKEANWTANGEMIHTDVKILVTDTVKGSVPSETVVTIPGGDLDGIKIRNGEAPGFELGEKVFVFAKEIPETGKYKTYGWFQGKYTVLNGMVRELNDVSSAQFRSEIVALMN